MNKSQTTPATLEPRTVETRDEMEALVGEIARLKTREQKLIAEMNRRLHEIRCDYDVVLGGIAVNLQGKMALASAWADANPGAFGPARSLALAHGDIGWRRNPPSLKTLSGWTWSRVLDKLRAGGHWSAYVRVKEEINKELLLSDRHALGAGALRAIGCRIAQEENFYVEPRLQDSAGRLAEKPVNANR